MFRLFYLEIIEIEMNSKYYKFAVKMQTHRSCPHNHSIGTTSISLQHFLWISMLISEEMYGCFLFCMNVVLSIYDTQYVFFFLNYYFNTLFYVKVLDQCLCFININDIQFMKNKILQTCRLAILCWLYNCIYYFFFINILLINHSRLLIPVFRFSSLNFEYFLFFSNQNMQFFLSLLFLLKWYTCIDRYHNKLQFSAYKQLMVSKKKKKNLIKFSKKARTHTQSFIYTNKCITLCLCYVMHHKSKLV